MNPHLPSPVELDSTHIDGTQDWPGRRPVLAPRERVENLLSLLSRWRLLILGFCGAVMILLVLLLATADRVYTSEAMLLVSPSPPNALRLEDDTASAPEPEIEVFFETQYELLRSRRLAEQVVRRLKLAERSDLVDQGLKANERAHIVVERYLEEFLSVAPPADTKLVRLSVRLPDPELAANALQAHIDGYVQQDAQIAEETRDVLSGELSSIEDRLAAAEAKLNRFRRETGFLSPRSGESLVLERLTELERRLLGAQIRRIEREAAVGQIEAGEYDSLPAVVGNDLIRDLKQDLVSAQGEYSSLATHLKDSHPQVAEIRSRMERILGEIENESERIVGALGREVESARNEELALREEIDAQHERTLQQKERAVEFTLLEGEVETARRLRAAVLDQLRGLDLTLKTRSSHVAVIDPPVAPLRPSWPRPLPVLGLGLLVSLVLALVLTFVAEELSDSVRSSRFAQEDLPSPLLGTVPVQRNQRWRDSEDSGLAESTQEVYRSIRTGMLYSRRVPPRGESRTFLFTSAVHGEDKSYALLNTALAFAELGKSVLIIDANFKRPTTHRVLGVSGQVGLAQFLREEADLQSALQVGDLGMSFLPSGGAAGDGAEILNSPKMHVLLKVLQENFTYILIDAPSVLTDNDAVVLSAAADGVVLVVDQSATSRTKVRDAQQRLSMVDANVIGSVLISAGSGELLRAHCHGAKTVAESLGAIWPLRYRVFDVGVSHVEYDGAVDAIVMAARQREGGLVDNMSVHGLMLARRDPGFRAALQGFDMVAADGQPVRWLLNRFWKLNLGDRVYGPEMMLRVCARFEQEGLSIYLYGGTPTVLSDLEAEIKRQFPSLLIAGSEAPPFRALSSGEEEQAADRINRSGASLVFIGLGCPKQELFAYRNRNRILAVQSCVGAAFDFHAGRKSMAPTWMQDRGLEWLYRFAQEPRRLFGRYVIGNTHFLLSAVRGNHSQESSHPFSR